MNKVILVGNLAKDPVVIKTKNNLFKTQYTIATNDTEKHTEYHRVVTFSKYEPKFQFEVGMQVWCEGKIQNVKYESTTGKTEQYTQIVANSVRAIR